MSNHDKILNNLETASDLENKIIEHPAFGIAYKWSKSDFELFHVLGRGSYGTVFAAGEKRTKFVVAIKVICRSKLENESVEKQRFREIEIHSKLQHPNIIRLYTYFHDKKHIFMALEIVTNGDLYKHLSECPLGYFEEQRASKYIYQVADALHYCHMRNVMHQYIRPENIFLTDDDNIKLSNFGEAIYKTDDTVCKESEPSDDKYNNNNEDDIRCLGVMCYELLTGDVPLYCYEKYYSFFMYFPRRLSSGARNLITGLLNEETRISLIDVMQHSWVRANVCQPKRKLIRA